MGLFSGIFKANVHTFYPGDILLQPQPSEAALFPKTRDFCTLFLPPRATLRTGHFF